MSRKKEIAINTAALAWSLAGAKGLEAVLKEAGYAIVPIEPTPEMIDAGDDQDPLYVRSVYRAMIAAAGDDQ